jgi:signal transduction histidine kinase
VRRRAFKTGAVKAVPVPARAAVFAGLLFAATWAVLVELDTRGLRLDSRHLESATRLVAVSTAVLALSIGGLSILRWRRQGDAGDLRVGAAVLLFGGLPIAACGFLFSSPHGTPAARAAHAAAEAAHPATHDVVVSFGLLLALALLVWRLIPRRSPTRGRAVLALEVGALVVSVVVALLVVPGLTGILSSPLTLPPSSGGGAAGQVFLGVVWASLAGLQWWRASSKGLQEPWLAMTFAALAQSRLALALSATGGAIWLTGSQLLVLEALLMALAGVNYHLARSFTRERLKVIESMATVQTIEAERAVERAATEERVHDIRAALFVIRGAAEMLHEHCDELDSATVSTLAQALASEVSQIQALTAARNPQPVQAVRLRDVLDPLILCEAQARTRVTSDIDDVLALARPADVAEVVRNLLDNVRRHAPGSPVHVEVRAADGAVRVSVEDQGPGVPEAERQVVLQRGVRGSGVTDAEGSGLGLYLAWRLINQQNGSLWIEDRPGGGTRVVFTLALVADPRGRIAVPGPGLEPGRTMSLEPAVIDLRSQPA